MIYNVLNPSAIKRPIDSFNEIIIAYSRLYQYIFITYAEVFEYPFVIP